MPRIAAIDFGIKRIGIALSDSQKKLALPYTTVEGGKKGVANTTAALLKKKSEIEKILVGLPLLMNGGKGEMASIVETFAKELEAATGIPVELCDERLSSKMADQSLRELSLNRKERSLRIDMAAAALFLQSYLDKNQF
jgi:putative Holliday junction resolvase